MAQELSSVEPLLPVFRNRPLAVFSDIDGTLSPIVENPADARVSPRCREILAQLIQKEVVVALLTGRTLEMAREMTSVDGVVFAANHGMSVFVDGHDETPGEVRAYMEQAKQIRDEIGGINVPGVFIEVTGPNLALHYRRASDEALARAAIKSALEATPSAKTFRVSEGRKVFELRPPLAIDKGTAVKALAKRLGVRALICLGDDLTDVDMFRAAHDLLQEGLPVAVVAVRSDETATEVLSNADYSVGGVPEVEWLLGEIVNAYS